MTGVSGDGALAQGALLGTREAELWQRVRAGSDPEARQLLMAMHLPYARIVAASYYGRRTTDDVEFDDYLQLARLGMVEALDRYDPAGGAQFRTFAARRMHGAILDGVERSTEKQRQIAVRRRIRQDRLQSLKGPASPMPGGESRNEIALLQRLAGIGIGLALGFLLEETGMYAGDLERAGPELQYRQIELRQLGQQLRVLVSRLPEMEGTVIRSHYLNDQPFESIATELGLSKGRISQIHRKALMSLRMLMGAHRRCDVAF